ncbi:MAG: hemolysin family protein [Bacteroidota bacterium]
MAVLLKVASVFVLVLLNGFFVAAEFALVKVRSSQIDMLARSGLPRAKVAQHVLAHLDTYLSACQVGITMTSLGLGWIGEPFVANLIAPLLEEIGVFQPAVIHTISFAIAFSTITFLHIVLGEVVPKWYAIRYARRTTLGVARPLSIFYAVFRPFIWLVNESANWFLRTVGIRPQAVVEAEHTADELRLLLSQGKAITALGRSISVRALDLRNRTVREIMVPRTNVVFLTTEWSIGQNVGTALENQYTRYPLCEKDLDNVVGMIHLKDLFKIKGESGPGERLLTIKREMIFVPETTSLEKVLNTFLAKRVLMAIAVDEYGGTAGLVTLENVLEEIVGDIHDEFDVEPVMVHRVADEEFLVDGSMPLHEFSSMFEIAPESKDVVTVSGYVIQLLDGVPEKGATLVLGQWVGTVEEVEAGRVKTLRMRKSANSPV